MAPPIKLHTFRCQICTVVFTLTGRQRGSRKRVLFCSRKCSSVWRAKIFKGQTFSRPPVMRGVDNPNYKGGSLSAQGYRQIYVNGKQVLEHRYIMEQHLKRKLLSTEIVHHRNENKIDNDIKNLELTTRRQHILMHNIAHLGVAARKQ